ncbi:MAG: efflux RND transporter periplasmic adaptor subunit [Pseudomonadota bacterium]
MTMIRDTSGQDELIEKRTGITRTRIVLMVVGMVVITLTVLVLPSYQRWASAEQTVSLDRIRLATVTRGDLSRDVSAQGKVVAAIKPTLFSTASGTATLLVQAGDQVTRGQLVATIDSPEIRNQLEQESSTLSSTETGYQRSQIEARKTGLENQQRVDLAEVALIAARRELRRAEAARAKDAISEFDYDKAKDDVATAELRFQHATADARLQSESLAFELQTAKHDLERQQLRVSELERQVTDLNIMSPVTGIVGNLLIENKDAVARNQPLLTVVDLSALEVELQVPDAYASALSLGLEAEVSHQGVRYAAELVSVSPEVINSQITAKVSFTGTTPPNLKQNQRVSARILLEGKPDVLMVERGPFLESSGGRFTYVVEDNLARRQRIEAGLVSVGNVEITSGLKEGQTVVISSLTDFNNAETVYLTN